MKIINADAKMIKEADFSSKYAFMEYIGRTCYKSTDHITADSGLAFVKSLTKSRHLAMLEHSHIIVKTTSLTAFKLANLISKTPIPVGKYLQFSFMGGNAIISGSFRTVIELLPYSKYSVVDDFTATIASFYKEFLWEYVDATHECVFDTDFEVLDRNSFVEFVNSSKATEEEKKKVLSRHLTHTVIFTCDRGVTHELVRHRPASFAQESTRYCNYSKDKFGKEITVISPCTLKPGTEEYDVWQKACIYAEKCYFMLLDQGVKAQMARDVLPTSLKTEIVVTANEEEWQHIINLRLKGTTGAPHPQMEEIMKIAYPLLREASEERLTI